MKILLWVNTILESLAGLLFLFMPEMLETVPGFDSLPLTEGMLLVRMYGVAALTLGIFSALLLFRLKYYQAVLVDGLLLFALFHCGLTIILFIYANDFRPGILHGTLALAFLAAFWKVR